MKTIIELEKEKKERENFLIFSNKEIQSIIRNNDYALKLIKIKLQIRKEDLEILDEVHPDIDLLKQKLQGKEVEKKS